MNNPTPLHIQKKIPVDLWKHMLQQDKNSTFFHTPEWLKVLLTHTPQAEDETIYCRFKSGNHCILPLMSTPLLNGLLKDLACLGPGSYSNFIGPVTKQEKHQVIESLLAQPEIFRFVFSNNPLQLEELIIPRSQKLMVVTHILRLSEGYEKIFQHSYSRNMRSKVRRSQKKGLDFEIKDIGQGLHDFYSLYELSVKRWGERLTQKRSYEFFQELAVIGKNIVKAGIVYRQGKPAAAALYYPFNKHVFYAFGAFDYSYRHLYPTIFLHDQALRYFVHQGYHYYDMGADAGLAGVKQMKESFGTENIEFPIYIWTSKIETA